MADVTMNTLNQLANHFVCSVVQLFAWHIRTDEQNDLVRQLDLFHEVNYWKPLKTDPYPETIAHHFHTTVRDIENFIDKWTQE